MKDRNVLVGEILKKHRIESGHSMQYVADKIGKTKAIISYWESGKRAINMSDVLDIVEKMNYNKERFAKDLMEI